MEQLGISVDIQARLDQFDQRMRAAGRLVETTTGKMDKATRRVQQGFTRIEAALDPVSRATARYERDVERVRQAVDRGAVSNTRALAVLDRLERQYLRATASTNQMVVATARGTSGTGAFGRGVQQAGFQVGDFATQIASGGNAIVALTQQGTQLISMFGGPWGAALGAAGAIAGALYISMSGVYSSTKEASKAVQDYSRFTDLSNELTGEAAEKAAILANARYEEARATRQLAADEARLAVERQKALIQRAEAELLQAGQFALGIDAQEQIAPLQEKLRELELQAMEADVALAEAAQRVGDFATSGASELEDRRKKIAETVEELKHAADASARLAQVTGLGEDAVRALNIELRVEKELRELGAEATAAQREEVERLVRADEANLIAIEALEEAMEKQKDVRERLLDTTRRAEEAERRLAAARNGPEALAALERQLELEEELREIREAGGSVEDLASAEMEISRRQRATKELEEFNKRTKEADALGKKMGESFGGAFEDFVFGAKSAGDAVRQLGLDIAKSLFNQAITQPIVSGLGGIFSSALGGLFGGFFAEGGRPPLGKVSVVGEKGPELFVPDRAGTIIPNAGSSPMSGGPSVVIGSIDMRGASVEAVNELRRLLNQVNASIEPRAIQAVTDKRARNPVALAGGGQRA